MIPRFAIEDNPDPLQPSTQAVITKADEAHPEDNKRPSKFIERKRHISLPLLIVLELDHLQINNLLVRNQHFD